MLKTCLFYLSYEVPFLITLCVTHTGGSLIIFCKTSINKIKRHYIFLLHDIFLRTSERISNSKIFLGLCPALSGSTNVAKRLDVIVYPGNIRRVTGHARPECATSIRFQLITVRTWCVGCPPPRASHPLAHLCPSIPLTIFDPISNTHTSI